MHARSLLIVEGALACRNFAGPGDRGCMTRRQSSWSTAKASSRPASRTGSVASREGSISAAIERPGVLAVIACYQNLRAIFLSVALLQHTGSAAYCTTRRSSRCGLSLPPNRFGTGFGRCKLLRLRTNCHGGQERAINVIIDTLSDHRGTGTTHRDLRPANSSP